MGEHRASSGPPGRQSLTFSADETLEDGSTIRTLETPAATIRFCFIDNVSSDSDSEELPDNVEAWKPPDVTNLSSSGAGEDGGINVNGSKEANACQKSTEDICYLSDSFSSSGTSQKSGEVKRLAEYAEKNGSEIVRKRTLGDNDSNTNDFQEEEVLKANFLAEENNSGQNSDKEHNSSGHGSDRVTNKGQTSPVDDRFTHTEMKVQIAIEKGFLKEHSSSPDQKSLSDRQSIGTCSSSGSTSSVVVSTPRSPRFNPFDRDVFVEEDHFSFHGSLMKGNPNNGSRQSLPNVVSPVHMRGKEKKPDSRTPLQPRKPEKLFTPTFTPCMPLQCLSRTNSDDYPRSVSSDDSGFLVKDENDITFADLGLAEDHFSQPEGSFGLSTTEELELAIESCKEMIMETGDNVERKKNLVGKLIQLRMRLQDAKEGSEETVVDADTKLVLGHKFKKKETGRSKHYCEKCNNVIWGMLQVWYRCSECGFCCHGKCLNLITRMCASIKVGESPSYILSICPEKGLASQQYRCSECRTVISFKSNYDEPRQCDYTGNYYCEQCHWNDTIVIPARVLHNWDFEPMKVCRASKQFLKLMTKRSVLRIQDINPMLFSFIEELNEVKKLREEILVMKKYFLSCQDALASKLLLQLKDRQHFVDNSDMYSMQDLLDIASDALVPELTKIHASFAQHIKADCELCQVKGFICELCDSQEILFPFDNHAIVCSQCSAVLHRHCYMKRGNSCPRCERRNKRSADES